MNVWKSIFQRRPGPAVWIALGFVLQALPFLRLAGIHYDAASELACFYPCSIPPFQVEIFGHTVPLMVLPYLGALKAWLYLPVLRYLEVTPVVLRVPFVLAGAGSVYLFFRILERVSGRPAAILGALLLATDTSFLIGTTYDFGPIALLHLFLLAAMFLVLRFEATRSWGYLAFAFFLLGLAMWHKALFIWMLGGLGAATLTVLPKRVWELFSVQRAAVAIGFFVLGSLPLIDYNLATGGATFQTTSVMSRSAPLAQKVLLFRKTLDSSVPFGWLTEDEKPETARQPIRLRDRISVKLTHAAGDPRSNWMPYIVLLSCCLLPWLWFTPSRRPAMFAVVYLAVTWGLMLVLPNTGATMHHVILLWPFPHFLAAIAFAQLSERLPQSGKYALMAGLTLALACNLLIVNHLYSDLVTRGTTVIWTDAVYPLLDHLDALEDDEVVAVDWGYAATLCLFSDGLMPLHDISFALLQPTDAEAAGIRSLLSEPKSLFVDHAEGGEQFPGVREHLSRIATEAGYVKRVVAVIKDRNMRPRFEISRYMVEVR
jgi:4-amino-4-deoxy-L-arabinose transferase-like glycosyltransferase